MKPRRGKAPALSANSSRGSGPVAPSIQHEAEQPEGFGYGRCRFDPCLVHL